MTENNKISYKGPRHLDTEETLHTLNHWIATAEVHYARDDQFECFFDEGTTWNPALEDWGLETETEGLKRTAAKKAKHLRYLLVILCSHVPLPHVQGKVLDESKSMKDVWSIISTAYSVVPTHDVFLGLLSLSKAATESTLLGGTLSSRMSS